VADRLRLVVFDQETKSVRFAIPAFFDRAIVVHHRLSQ
jgi:hypothetical protein